MKKPNVSKQPPPKPTGFGFGDAMFAVKNLTADYSQFDDPPSFDPKPIQPFKNPSKPPTLTKPASVGKAVQAKPTTIQQKQETTLPKEVFKIAVGNQYKNNSKRIILNQLQCVDGVFQLTARKQLSRWEYNVFCDGVPADKIVQKPQISFNFNAQDLKQGQLGNCYFIAALASLAHMPELLRQRVPDFKKYNGMEKSFRATMFESGKLIEVIVDNLFPNVYVRPVGNDISPMLLQKAYAQVYGSFEVVNLGYAIDAMRDLSGAPTEELTLKDKVQLRKRVQECFQNRFGMVIASKVEGVSLCLSAKHSYNVLNFDIYNGQLFLQLRDPRGWTKASFDAPSQLGKPDNGCFWVGEKDLQNNFQMISVGKYMKNYTYFYKAFSEKQLTNNNAGLFIHLKSPMKVFITLHQKHKKFFDENFIYKVIRLMVTQIEISKEDWKVIRTLKVSYKSQQICCIEVDLQAKSYMILGQIVSQKSKNLFPDEAFTISVYSQRRQINFQQLIGNVDLKPLLISYINQNKQQFEETSKHDCHKYFGQAFGFICLYYENKGDKQISEEIIYTVKNIEITEKKVILLPKQTKLIMHPILAGEYQCSMKSNTLYK